MTELTLRKCPNPMLPSYSLFAGNFFSFSLAVFAVSAVEYAVIGKTADAETWGTFSFMKPIIANMIRNGRTSYRLYVLSLKYTRRFFNCNDVLSLTSTSK